MSTNLTLEQLIAMKTLLDSGEIKSINQYKNIINEAIAARVVQKYKRSLDNGQTNGDVKSNSNDTGSTMGSDVLVQSINNDVRATNSTLPKSVQNGTSPEEVVRLMDSFNNNTLDPQEKSDVINRYKTLIKDGRFTEDSCRVTALTGNKHDLKEA